MFVPVFDSVRISFTNWDGFSKTFQYVGFRNYAQVLGDPNIYKAFWVTFKISFLIILLQQAFGLILALILEGNSKVNEFFRSLFFIPNLLNSVVVGLVFSYALSLNFGFIGPVFDALGLHGLAQIDWLGDGQYAAWAIVFACVWQFSGLSMVLYIGSLKGIPMELYESADIDGASVFQRFKNVTFPLIMPAVTLNSLITLIGCIRLFDIPYVLTGGGPADATKTIALRMYQDTFANRSAGIGATEAVILLLVITVFSVIQTSYLKSKEVNM
jgi:raffinose/stachyose/melibiose transport system permease protein